MREGYMKKAIREVDEKRGIWQITTFDERWYAVPSTSKKAGIPEYQFLPSVTYITAYYPKGKFFEEWLKKNGEEADLIKRLAGEKGTKIHKAVEMLVEGEEVRMESKFVNPTSELEEELSVEEYEAILSFVRFWEDLTAKHQIKVIASEYLVVSSQWEYAGTTDLILEIDGEIHIIDVKTGQNVYEDYKLQVSAYKQAMKEMSGKQIIGEMGRKLEENEDIRLSILQLGYKRNKNGYKLTEVEDKFDLFIAARKIWSNETGQKVPLQREYPTSVKLNLEFPKVAKKEKVSAK